MGRWPGAWKSDKDAPTLNGNGKVRLCLAASGGGHVRQLLDLEAIWSGEDYFFVTEDTALGRSIAEDHETHFVPHVALGQAKLGAPFKMVGAAVRNLFGSLRIILQTRPHVVLTTGAGSVFFSTFWARLFGARIVVIDSFARFDRPSVFARVTGLLAHVRVAQAQKCGENWSGAHIFDPLRVTEPGDREKDALVFATVGATLPFDRLVNMVDNARAAGLLPERIVMQCGRGGTQLPGVECHESLPFDEMKQILRRADIVICHGGTGSLITALREGCRVVAIARRFDRGEHYDDHQSEITEAFVNRGLIAAADNDEEFAAALQLVRSRNPKCATTDPSALVGFLQDYIADMKEGTPSVISAGA